MTLLQYFENQANKQAYIWEKEILDKVEKAREQDTYLIINHPRIIGKRFLIDCTNEYYKFEKAKNELLDRIGKQIYEMCGLPNTILEENKKTAVRELQKYEDKRYKEKWDDYFKYQYQCEWIGLEDDTKWSKDTKIDKSKFRNKSVGG